MATEQNQQTFTFTSHADLSAKQYYAVTFVSTGDVDVATAAKACAGILQNKPTAGRAASVARSGVSKAAISASSNVAVGDMLEVDTGGTLKKVASGTVVAQALEATNVASVAIISVMLLPSNALFA